MHYREEEKENGLFEGDQKSKNVLRRVYRSRTDDSASGWLHI